MITIEKFRNESGNIYAHLSYEPGRNYLFMRWIGYSTEAEVMHASKAMMQWQKEEGRRTGEELPLSCA